MSQGLIGGSSNSTSDHHSFRAEPLHVAQQSRRDKLRHQFFSDISTQNPNPNHELLYNCTNMLMNSSGILDLTHDTSSFINPSSASDCWINNTSTHPLFQSHVYHVENQHLSSSSSSYENTLQAMINASSSSSLLGFEGGFIDHHHQKVASAETQGLVLSLASNPHIDAAGFNSCPNVPPKFLVDHRRSVGPLGPFTGYATILKSSKFLKPAQQLMDEFCSAVTGSNRSIRSGNSRGVSTLPTLFHSRNEGGEGSGANCLIYQQPEIQQKKVKLLYMQEEVCRRYNQYRQQMKMVLSSFESVAGLSAATPYTSLALEVISKQFKCIKQAISNQLRHVSRVLGEDFTSSPVSSSRGKTITTPRLKHLDQSLRKQKASENTSIGFLDNNQPVWRSQRGLPERAVSVLKAWLFEHFLHPYPTDTDKHMLATQTGLTRNQVSNWFINARVRLWKPMVEEIHMLESKGVSEMDLNSSNKNGGKSIVDDQGSEAVKSHKAPLDSSSSVEHSLANHESNPVSMEQWHCEKRSRMEEIDGGLLSFGYPGGLDIGGLGAVSLTLGLRQNEDPQQRHFGSQMLHDFVG